MTDRLIVLAMPPYTSADGTPRIGQTMPLGLGCIAAVLEQSNFKVKLIDSTLEEYNTLQTKNAILELQPELIGMFSYTSTIADVYDVCKALKKDKPEIGIVLGGPHVSALPEETFKECSAIDAIIIGEGDYAFRDLARVVLNEGFSQRLAGIEGVMFRRGGKIFGEPKAVIIENLDELPFPSRHLFNIQKYLEDSKKHSDVRNPPAANLITSRGCPAACIYCCKSSGGGYRFRSRSPEKVVAEMEQLENMGFKEIEIMDNTFTFDTQRVHKICNLIKKRKLKLNFSLPNGVRANRIDEKLLKNMYEAGFYSIIFGVESGDDKILKIIKKGISVSDVRIAVKSAKKAGFHVGLFLIVGLPGSSPKSEENTCRFIKELDPDFISVAPCCTPYPGSPLWHTLRDGLNNIVWKDSFRHTFVNKILYVPEELTEKQMKHYHKKMYYEFYGRPTLWLRHFLRWPTWTLRKMRIWFSIARKRKFYLLDIS